MARRFKNEDEKIAFLKAMQSEIDQVVSEIQTKFGKYICKYKWLSGSSTDVYPIMVWRDYIGVQLMTSDKMRFSQRSLDKIVEAHKDLLSRASFDPTDDSCPSCLRFRFVE